MTPEFRKPFAAPPTIFGIALILGVIFGFVVPAPALPLAVQLTLGPVLILCGVFLIVRSIRDIEAAGTTYDPFAASTELVTTGIYRYSRNPGYLGLAVIQLGAAVALDNIWIAVSGVFAVLVTTRCVIKLEEAKLAATFGEPYADYCRHVPRWAILSGSKGNGSVKPRG